MRLGIPRDTKSGECRVAVTPSGVRALHDSGAGIVVETGAGTASGFEDREYHDAGATIVPTAPEAWAADLVVKVKEPLPAEFRFLSKSSTLLTFLHLAAFPQLTEELLARRGTGAHGPVRPRGGRRGSQGDGPSRFDGAGGGGAGAAPGHPGDDPLDASRSGGGGHRHRSGWVARDIPADDPCGAVFCRGRSRPLLRYEHAGRGAAYLHAGVDFRVGAVSPLVLATGRHRRAAIGRRTSRGTQYPRWARHVRRSGEGVREAVPPREGGDQVTPFPSSTFASATTWRRVDSMFLELSIT